MNRLNKDHVGARLLVTDRLTEVSRDEIEVLEVSPSGSAVKVCKVRFTIIVAAGTLYLLGVGAGLNLAMDGCRGFVGVALCSIMACFIIRSVSAAIGGAK